MSLVSKLHHSKQVKDSDLITILVKYKTRNFVMKNKLKPPNDSRMVLKKDLLYQVVTPLL